MQNRDKNLKSSLVFTELPIAPPLNDADVRGTTIDRSKQLFLKVAKGVGIVVCAVAIVSPVAKQVDTIVANTIWHQDTLDVAYIPAVEGSSAENMNEAYIAFPGVGQKDTKNAATEHFRATNAELPAAYVSLPNQGFTIQQLAHEVDDLIDEKNLDKVNIIGVSAGTQLALQTITYIEEHPEEFSNSPGEEPLPEIGYFLANSSPYDEQSAYKGSIIEPVMNQLEESNYRSGIAEKFIYSLVDGPGDINKLLPNTTQIVNISYIYDSVKQTFNSTAPLMVQDHLMVLNDFDAEEQKDNWVKVLTPTTKFLYFHPSKGQDMVVDNQKAYIQFSETLQELNVTSEYVPIDSEEHADTVQAAIAFGNWVLSLQQSATSSTYNPYPEESKLPSTS